MERYLKNYTGPPSSTKGKTRTTNQSEKKIPASTSTSIPSSSSKKSARQKAIVVSDSDEDEDVHEGHNGSVSTSKMHSNLMNDKGKDRSDPASTSVKRKATELKAKEDAEAAEMANMMKIRERKKRERMEAEQLKADSKKKNPLIDFSQPIRHGTSKVAARKKSGSIALSDHTVDVHSEVLKSPTKDISYGSACHSDESKTSVVSSDPVTVSVSVKTKKRPVTPQASPSPGSKRPKLTQTSSDQQQNSPAKKASFKDFMSRAPPSALGTKVIPRGAPMCLDGLKFVITGEQESITRDELKDLILSHGGRVMTSVSSKTDYVVLGRDAGPSKLAKIKEFSLKTVDDDGLFTLIMQRPAGTSSVGSVNDTKNATVSKDKKGKRNVNESSRDNDATTATAAASWLPRKKKASENSSSDDPVVPNSTSERTAPLLWVEKYKPKKVTDLIDNKGLVQKLLAWLKNWHDSRSNERAVNASKSGGGSRSGSSKSSSNSDSGGGFRAALLSGAPGVGKTSAALLVCAELGFEAIEFNASDTRSKASLKQHVSTLLGSRSITSFMGSAEKVTTKKRQCIIMDEVDGMSAGDRGGSTELIALIKTTKVPIICICNDRQSPKMRTFSSHCFDLKFSKPQVARMVGPMMKICFREGLKIDRPCLEQIITSTNCDIRQTISLLSMWAIDEKAINNYDETKERLKHTKKDMKSNIFDVVKLIMEVENYRRCSLEDRLNYFFMDDMTSLFIQENYLVCDPASAHLANAQSEEELEYERIKLASLAADSIADGDILARSIRSEGNWGLMPAQGMLSACAPAYYMHGRFTDWRTNFPMYLGNYSKTNKTSRLQREIQLHMRLCTSGDKSEISNSYLPLLRTVLTKPLIELGDDGIPVVTSLMDTYYLCREDWDSVMELSQWSEGISNPVSQICGKTKSAFTRLYNKSTHMLPYSVGMQAAKKKVAGASAAKEVGLEDVEGENDDDNLAEDNVTDEPSVDDISADKSIKASVSKKSVVSKSTTSKGKGKGKAAK